MILLGGIVELGLRLTYPDGVSSPLDPQGPFQWLESDAILAWRNRAHYEQAEFSINDLHLRGGAVRQPTPSRRRIVCLGDSRTFGIWLDLGRFRYDNDFPRYLGELFATRPGPQAIEVLNAGVIGYSSAQGLRWVRTGLIDELHPDLLILAFGVNDYAPSWNPALRTPDPATPLGRSLLRRSSSLRLWQLSLAAWRRVPAVHAAPMSVPWVDHQHYGSNLRRLARATRRRGVDPIFVDIGLRPLEMGPSLPAFPGASTNDLSLYGAPTLEGLHRLHDSYRDILLQVGRQEGVPVIDGTGALAAASKAGASAFGAYDFTHPNVDGAKLLARAVYDALESEASALSNFRARR